MVKGLRAEMMYFKQTLDKSASAWRSNTPAGTRTSATCHALRYESETREVMNSLVDDLYTAWWRASPLDAGNRRTKCAPLSTASLHRDSGAQGRLVDALRLRRSDVGRTEGRLKAEPSVCPWTSTPGSLRNPWPGGQEPTSRWSSARAILRGNPGDDGAGENSLTSYGSTSSSACGERFPGEGRGGAHRFPGGEVHRLRRNLRQMNLLSKKKPV